MIKKFNPDRKARHYAHYQRRGIILEPARGGAHPWYAVAQRDYQGLDRPEFHVTRLARGPAARIEPGDTIWVFSQLGSAMGKLPPALDCKLVVSDVRPWRGRGLKYTAGPGSRWFPLFDASETIRRLRSVQASGKFAPLLKREDQPVGTALQSMREIENRDALTDLAREVDDGGFDFVSYRLADGTGPAFKKVLSLMREGGKVFWDRWSLPRRLAERREHIQSRALNAHILSLIDRARKVWIISSPRYAEEESYSLKELNRAVLLKKAIFVNPEEN